MIHYFNDLFVRNNLFNWTLALVVELIHQLTLLHFTCGEYHNIADSKELKGSLVLWRCMLCFANNQYFMTNTSQSLFVITVLNHTEWGIKEGSFLNKNLFRRKKKLLAWARFDEYRPTGLTGIRKRNNPFFPHASYLLDLPMHLQKWKITLSYQRTQMMYSSCLFYSLSGHWW